MTIDRINLGPLAPVDRFGGEGGSSAAIATGSAKAVAVAVVGRIAAELKLTGEAPRGNADYGLAPLADTISAHYGASPAAAGDLARAIEGLAGAIAADMAALADGRTLDRVDAAVADAASATPGEGVGAVTEILERAADGIAAAR